LDRCNESWFGWSVSSEESGSSGDVPTIVVFVIIETAFFPNPAGRATNRMSKFRRFGWLCLLAIIVPSLGWWYAAPRAAQALTVPLSWVGLSTTNSDVPTLSLGLESAGSIELAPPIDGSLPLPLEMHGLNVEVQSGPAMYSLCQVMQWAYDRSPEAKLIESEVDAVTRGIDPKDPDACCSARLVRNVLREVALARRYDDATHAAVAYHKLLAATEAVEFARQAIAVHDKLIAMADEAERLEIPDGNPLKLRQKKLDLVQLKTEQTFNTLKLRQELSRLTGRSEAEVATAVMTDVLPGQAPAIVAGEAVATAITQRRDLRAVQVLCRELRSCNVDAARLLMGMVSPGIGLSLAAASKGGLFECLKDDKSDDDLNARRRQCSQMRESLEVVIRNETLQAVLDVRSAGARLKLIDEQIQLASSRLDEVRGMLKLETVTPGSDFVVELELFELRGDRLAMQKTLALAIDDIEHAKSTPIH
jgi:hypothetical protein